MFESLEAFLIKQYPLPQTMMDAVMLTGANKNCEEDVDKFPLTLSRAAQATDMEILVPQVTEYQQMLIDLPIAVSSILPLAEQLDSTSLFIGEINVLAYIAGFIIRKLEPKICYKCSMKIQAPSSPGIESAFDENVGMIFINMKCYHQCQDGLKNSWKF
jgi:hypothetical protein